ncbi:hypothetical protein [Marinobacterium mangrovicola]|uniref:Small secreted protein n=1 Tax=Marinobacterium mangrovicola TaxID=1476959 RepID=A0A4R1GQ06_9GAMM|nr:hypothetical protein [Marinobacterium mangrovicola]TCK09541.1 hypothetical protein CLV83_1651 [Marinobacterium mangrovicola]
MKKWIAMPLVTLVSVLMLSACSEPEGPAEKAGAKIDEVATDTGNAIEDSCEEFKEGVGADDTDC